MSKLPAHVSPVFQPAATTPTDQSSPQVHDKHVKPDRHIPYLDLEGTDVTSSTATSTRPETPDHRPPPPSLLSPAFTPPVTPAPDQAPSSYQVESSSQHKTPGPKLLDALPEVNCIVRARIPTTTGTEMFLHLYQNNVDSKEHLAIVFGPHVRSRSLDAVREGETEMDRMIRGAYTGRLYPGRTTSGMSAAEIEAQRRQEEADKTAPLVRIHSECYTGETVWSARCDCGEQLDEAARLMSLPEAKSGGVIVYLRQEGRGIGLGEKLKAYNLQDLGSDTVEANLLLRHPADARSYGLATAMLVDLGLGGERGIKLLTNNPDKVRAVEGPNREVICRERVAMVPLAWSSGGQKGFSSAEVGNYLKTKVRLTVRLVPTVLVNLHADTSARSSEWATCSRWANESLPACQYDTTCIAGQPHNWSFAQHILSTFLLYIATTNTHRSIHCSACMSVRSVPSVKTQTRDLQKLCMLTAPLFGSVTYATINWPCCDHDSSSNTSFQRIGTKFSAVDATHTCYW